MGSVIVLMALQLERKTIKNLDTIVSKICRYSKIKTKIIPSVHRLRAESAE